MTCAAKINCCREPAALPDVMLRVTVVDEHNDKTYNLNFPGSHTVLEVKRDVATVTGIAVFRQSWAGWPPGVNDDISLVRLGLQDEAILRVNRVIKVRGNLETIRSV